MDRVYSLLLGAAVTLGVLGIGASVAQLVALPPDSDLGARIVVDAGPTPPDASLTAAPTSPGPTASPEASPTVPPPARVPINPPVVVDDDRDDDEED